MKHQTPGYLCLTDLLDQDLSAYEYFQTLPPAAQTALRREDSVTSFEELQSRAEHLSEAGFPAAALPGNQTVF